MTTTADTDFPAIVAGLPQPYLVLDSGLVIVGASDVYLSLTDRIREDIVGRHILEAFPENPDAAGTVEQGPLEVSLRHVLATGRTHEMAVIQYDIPRPDGGFEQKFWTPIHTPVLGPDGAVRYIVQNPMDVTESVIRQREADARLRVALHAADLATWEYEPETDMLRRSRAFDEMFGFRPGEAGSLAAPFFDCIHPEDKTFVQAAIWEAIERPDQTLVRFDFRIVLPSGEVRYAASRGEVLRTSSGRGRLLGVMMDITQDREREAALREAVSVQEGLLAEKDALLAEVNHRVKNSLQLVVSVLSLQARRLEPREAKAVLDTAIARVRAITSVHERLYKDEDPFLVDMADYLEGLAADLAGRSPLGDRVEIRVDPLHLRTERAIPVAVIVNELVTNALHHAYPTGSSGPIILTLKARDPDMLELSVEDDGIATSGGTMDEGFGSRLVRTMAAQIEGTVEFGGRPRGHRAAVVFPRLAP